MEKKNYILFGVLALAAIVIIIKIGLHSGGGNKNILPFGEKFDVNNATLGELLQKGYLVTCNFQYTSGNDTYCGKVYLYNVTYKEYFYPLCNKSREIIIVDPNMFSMNNSIIVYQGNITFEIPKSNLGESYNPPSKYLNEKSDKAIYLAFLPNNFNYVVDCNATKATFEEIEAIFKQK